MKWEKVKLGDICKYVTSGGTPKSSIKEYYEPKQIPWLKTKEVNYCRIYETESYISKDGLDNSSAKMIPQNSVIVAMYGQGDTAGRVAINKIPLTTNQACCNLIIDETKACYEFVYYQLVTLYEKMVSLKNGGAQPNLNAAIIKSMEIKLPPLKTQRYIADILSSYDDLIENNQKQIKLLEEAAQRLYKEWFVDLRFPGHENTKIVDGVPEGWSKSTVFEVSAILRRGISPKYNENARGIVINQKCIRQTIVSYDEARTQEKKYPAELELKEADIAICSTGAGTLGRVGQIYEVRENTTLDSHVTLIRANEKIGQQSLFWSLKMKQDYLMNAGKGSTNQLELSRETIGNCKILMPEQKIAEQAEKNFVAIHNKMKECSMQIARLREARDLLLPKLMSGGVKMPRRNFLQILQDAKIDIKREYQRLFDLFYTQSAPDYNGRYQTLRQVCENNFLIVPFRGTCLSLNDFDDFYNYNFGREPWGFNLDYLLSFCEYSYNFIKWMSPQNPLCISGSASQQQFYLQQVKTVIEEIGYMETIEQNITLFVPKKQEAIAVSEIVAPEISYKVLEYNHYTMKGDIARKRETLRILADQLEPRRVELAAINKELANNVFFMFNNMNIRHNNCAEGDKNYKKVVAKMSQDELESWYDETYQLCLLAFLELDNVERTKKVAELKASFGK